MAENAVQLTDRPALAQPRRRHGQKLKLVDSMTVRGELRLSWPKLEAFQ
jgi:hypothetical protein